jgi:hypothetical protein
MSMEPRKSSVRLEPKYVLLKHRPLRKSSVWFEFKGIRYLWTSIDFGGWRSKGRKRLKVSWRNLSKKRVSKFQQQRSLTTSSINNVWRAKLMLTLSLLGFFSIKINTLRLRKVSNDNWMSFNLLIKHHAVYNKGKIYWMWHWTRVLR